MYPSYVYFPALHTHDPQHMTHRPPFYDTGNLRTIHRILHIWENVMTPRGCRKGFHEVLFVHSAYGKLF